MTQNTQPLAKISQKIKALEKNSIQNVVEIGKLLQEASEQCEYGEYMNWLKSQFGWSHQTSLRYRSVYNLSQNQQIVDFAKLDISISALYEVADLFRNFFDLPICLAAGEAIINAAKSGRVTYRMTRDIIRELREAEARKETEPPEPDSAIKPEEPLLPKPFRLTSDDTDTIVKLFYNAACHSDGGCAKVIKIVGPAKIHEIIRNLKAALDRYNQCNEVKGKADAAEARRNAVAVDEKVAL